MNWDYNSLKSRDLIEPLQQALDRGELIVDDHGDIRPPQNANDYDSPWIHVSRVGNRNCWMWNRVIFRMFGLLPIGCVGCWKVVVRPTTVEGLFALLDLQIAMGRESKCGVELRPEVCGNYGGYFYNNSQKQGLDCYADVRAAVDADPALGPEVKVILKRGCTEMEAKFGPSDEWTVPAKQPSFEAHVERYVKSPPQAPQGRVAKDHKARLWIEYAYSLGDLTYLKFTGGEPLYPAYVTYHPARPGAEEAELDDDRVRRTLMLRCVNCAGPQSDIVDSKPRCPCAANEQPTECYVCKFPRHSGPAIMRCPCREDPKEEENGLRQEITKADQNQETAPA